MRMPSREIWTHSTERSNSPPCLLCSSFTNILTHAAGLYMQNLLNTCSGAFLNLDQMLQSIQTFNQSAGGFISPASHIPKYINQFFKTHTQKAQKLAKLLSPQLFPEQHFFWCEWVSSLLLVLRADYYRVGGRLGGEDHLFLQRAQVWVPAPIQQLTTA